MTRPRRIRLHAGLVIALSCIGAAPATEHETAEATAAPAPIPEPRSFSTSHGGRFGGETLRYTATAGETHLKSEAGKPTASIFSIAYIKDGVDDPAARPVTFLWNGGPGSSSVWLHMGAFGPRRVVVPSEAEDDGAPPFRMEDNGLTILDATDLVFVDPVGTGYSRPLGEHEGKEFWGVTEDARSIAAFIRSWITTNKRWASPKYIGGESYGTTRTAAVIHELEGGFDDVSINGLILISTVMDFYTSSFQTGNELGYITFLPTMAATAWYHGKIEPRPDDLEAFLAEAREFALTDYATALLRGNTLPGDERRRIRERLSHFTGIRPEYFDLSDLRITERRFFKELLRDRGLTVGRLDGRYTGEDLDDAGENVEADPSFYGIDGAYTAAVNHYLTAELDVEMDRPYRIFGRVFRDWNWEIETNGFRSFNVNVAPYIGTAMRQNRELRVFNAAGYYDFATPFFDAELSFMRNGVVPERITYAYYESGHMMYVHRPSLEKLMIDVRDFIRAGGRGR
jgi:carboxypeptidase C (cathepsin A)